MRDSSLLVLNTGSSSIKAAIYKGNELILETQLNNEHPDMLVDALTEWVDAHVELATLDAIGHRIVHGGTIFTGATLITGEVQGQLESLVSLDPDHMPNALKIIDVMRLRLPDVPQIACFDTAFFHDLPRVAQILPLPRKYEAEGLRKYGFHGLSYQSVISTLQSTYEVDVAHSKIICAHLGSGVSLTAIANGHPLDTTMAMTPASGVPMSTRSGSIDPGIAQFLHDKDRVSAEEFNEIVNKASGLLGISETSADMYTLLQQESSDVRSKEAVEVFCYEVKKAIGALTAVLGGLDVLVFAGGMGENAPLIRKRVCDGLGYIGVGIDDIRNEGNQGIISVDGGDAAVYVVHTNEALVMVSQIQEFLHTNTKQGA